MEVKITSLTDEGRYCLWGAEDIFMVEMDGEVVFEVKMDEDSDIYAIPEMLEQAFLAGQNGETFDILRTHVDKIGD